MFSNASCGSRTRRAVPGAASHTRAAPLAKTGTNSAASGHAFQNRDLTVFNGLVYFHAFDEVRGREPWVTDGTPAGTVPVQLPNTVRLFGAQLVLQWATIGPAGPFLNLAAFSDPLRVRVGKP